MKRFFLILISIFFCLAAKGQHFYEVTYFDSFDNGNYIGLLVSSDGENFAASFYSYDETENTDDDEYYEDEDEEYNPFNSWWRGYYKATKDGNKTILKPMLGSKAKGIVRNLIINTDYPDQINIEYKNHKSSLVFDNIGEICKIDPREINKDYLLAFYYEDEPMFKNIMELRKNKNTDLFKNLDKSASYPEAVYYEHMYFYKIHKDEDNSLIYDSEKFNNNINEIGNFIIEHFVLCSLLTLALIAAIIYFIIRYLKSE